MKLHDHDMIDQANRDAAKILRELMAKHRCLQPDSEKFLDYDPQMAVKIVGDLIAGLEKSLAILDAQQVHNWGKR
jgi:hypothetical protein